MVTVEETFEKKLTFIKNLYSTVLYNDDYWHFFYEYDKIVVRYTSENFSLVKSALKKNLIKELSSDGAQVTYSFGNYKENIDITNKYYYEFIAIFNAFSILATKIEHDADLYAVTDRVLHCWLNMATCDGFLNSLLKSTPENNLNFVEEAIIGHVISTGRSFVSGFFLGNNSPLYRSKYRPRYDS